MNSTRMLSLAALSLMTASFAVAQTAQPPSGGANPPSANTGTGTGTTGTNTQPSRQGATDAGRSGAVTWYQKANDDWPASEIIGSTVRNKAGDNIGDVNELILGNDGNVRAVVIGVGGFLGMGERDVAVSFKSLSITRDEDNDEVITVDATKDTLSSAPQWQRQRTGG